MRRIVVLVVLLSAGCIVSQLAIAQEMTLVRMAHLVEDVAAVQIYMDGVLVKGYLQSGTATGHFVLSAGKHRIRIHQAQGERDMLMASAVTLQSKQVYTLALTGTFKLKNLKLLVLVDDLSGIVSSGKVRFVHAAPDAPSVSIAFVNGSVVSRNISFGQSSGYLSEAPGKYDLVVSSQETGEEIALLQDVLFASGVNCTVFLTSSAGDHTLKAVAFPDTESREDVAQIWVGVLLWAALLVWFALTAA